MKRFTKGLVPVAALAIVLACGDSTGVQPADLAGTWTATSARFTSVADPTTTVDPIALGMSLTLVIESNGAITITTTEPGGTPEVEVGTMTVNGSDVTLTAGDPTSGTISLSGDILTVNLTSGVTFDFDDDDVDEPATVIVTFRRA